MEQPASPGRPGQAAGGTYGVCEAWLTSPPRLDPQEPDSHDGHRALRREVRFLGDLLGEVLREQGGDELFAAVERVRLLTKRLRSAYDEPVEQELLAYLEALPAGLCVQVARAFGLYFQLVNLAEQHHRVRRRREYGRLGRRPQRASLASLVAELKARGLGAAEALDLLSSLSVELVVTAHPTEASRRTALALLRELYELLERREDPRLGPLEAAELEDRMKEILTLLWQTREIRAARPAPSDELRRTLFYFDQTFWDVLPRLHEGLERELAREYPEIAARLAAGERVVPILVRVRSWVGGDRDGNPHVTAAVTWDALCRQRDLVVRRYMAALRELMARFGQSAQVVPVHEALLASVTAEEAALRPPPMGFVRWNEDEPYRRKLAVMYWRLELLRRHNLALQPGADRPAGQEVQGRYRTAGEFLEDLRLIERSLLAARGQAVVRGSLGRLVRQVEQFGFHLAPIEIRQHSGVHEAVLDELLQRAGIETRYRSLDEPARTALLEALLERPERLAALSKVMGLRNPPPGGVDGEPPEPETAGDLSEAAREMLRLLSVIRWARAEMGEQAVDTYLISMAGAPSDVLEVMALEEAAAVGGRPPLKVVPIIETIADLRGASRLLESLLRIPAFRRRVGAWGDVIEVMLGYSDSSKDGGYLPANWALYRAQQQLLAVGARHGVRVRFFHGRGGALGRGGGPMTRAVAGLPDGATRAGFKLTEQGEVLSERYLIPEIAIRSLEQTLWAVAMRHLEQGAAPESAAVAPQWEATMEELAEAALRAYRDFLFGDGEAGLRFFFTCTPIAFIGRLNIGSRPEARQAGRRFEALRAIPWVFAWNQSRLLLPAWYGVGTALERFAADGPSRKAASGVPAGPGSAGGGAAVLKEMYRNWPFFRAMIDNLQMALSKADMHIAARYAALLGGESGRAVFEQVRLEYERTRNRVLEVTGQRQLLEREPVLQQSIRLRNPYVDALSYLQLLFLNRHRACEQDETLRTGILVTIAGVAAGLRNTG